MNKIVVLSLISVLLAIAYHFCEFKIFNYLYSSTFSGNGDCKRLLTAEELQTYNGIDKPELYLALLGIIFNVTEGAKYYGPGETYNVFVGCDASRSFITGKFDKADASDDVVGLSKQELLSLDNWMRFYKKQYSKIGKLIGRYYDKNGKATPYCKEIKKLIKQAESEKDVEDLRKLQFPPCNVEWDAKTGSRVWCTKRSGGIERRWIGVPRKLYEPGSDSYRCACINEEDLNLGNLQEYEDCDPMFSSCYVKT